MHAVSCRSKLWYRWSTLSVPQIVSKTFVSASVQVCAKAEPVSTHIARWVGSKLVCAKPISALTHQTGFKPFNISLACPCEHPDNIMLQSWWVASWSRSVAIGIQFYPIWQSLHVIPYKGQQGETAKVAEAAEMVGNVKWWKVNRKFPSLSPAHIISFA